jgi:hypothetical protein
MRVWPLPGHGPQSAEFISALTDSLQRRVVTHMHKGFTSKVV